VITPLPQETIAWLHQAAAAGAAEPMVLRHVMQRLDALETSLLAEPIERETLRSIFRSHSDHHRRLLNLEAAQQQPANPAPAATEMVPTSKGAPVATDDELFDLFHQHDPLGIVLRAIYNLGRQHGAAQLPAAKSDLEPNPPAAPAGGLVERVATAMHPNYPRAFQGEARAAICEMAEWLDREGYNRAANDFREEVVE